MSQYRHFRDLARVVHGGLLVLDRVLAKPSSQKIIQQNIAITSTPKLFPEINAAQDKKKSSDSLAPSVYNDHPSAIKSTSFNTNLPFQRTEIQRPSLSVGTKVDLPNRNLVRTSSVDIYWIQFNT